MSNCSTPNIKKGGRGNSGGKRFTCGILDFVTYKVKVVLWVAFSAALPSLACQNIPAKPDIIGVTQSGYTPHLSFDVASIRESHDGNISYIDTAPTSSLYHAVRVSAWGIILTAYEVKIGNLLTNLPNWATTTKYDLMAKSETSTDAALAKLSDSDSYAEKHHMLRELLADRFKLQIHPETRISTTYELVITDAAAKLMTPIHGDVAVTVSTCNRHYSKKGIEVLSKGCPFTILLNDLRQEFGTEIVDHTGLSGMYAYHLMWSFSSELPADGVDRYPLLADALREQLGLRLKPTKGPVTFWVVDHIERPTPN